MIVTADHGEHTYESDLGVGHGDHLTVARVIMYRFLSISRAVKTAEINPSQFAPSTSLLPS